MRYHLRLPSLAVAAVVLFSACSPSGATTAPSAAAPSAAAPSAAAPSAAAPSEAASGAASTALGIDDGTKLTMWTRAATEARARPLVDAYNKSHKNQIELTVTPTDDYQAKVGAAAGANGLPDLFSADVVFMPNWTSQGLFQDITSKIAGLPYADKIAQAHINASTWEGKQYGLPFIVDLSVWLYNKALYRKAGLDPEKPPTTLQEFADQARAVAKLGGDIHGTFFGGNCGGCEVFTWWPIAWADGEKVMDEGGTTSFLNSDENKQIYSTFKSLVDDGTVWMPDSKTETGPTWTSYFQTGKVGIMPWPATTTGLAGDNLKLEDVGATPIAGVKGGQSTFVGGDSIGIGRDSKVPDQAFNFLAWLEDEQAQVDVIAKGGNVVSRTDLANNQYSAADPRLVMFNTIAGQGQTPFALKFGQTFNDPQGPWLVLLRDAVFGDASKIDADNDAINDSLQP
jgi:multiple sugar transport system substrate-binding protein